MLNKKSVFTFTTLVLVILILLLCLPTKKVLLIYNRKNPGEYYLVNTHKLNGFEISYTHSVNKGRVHDFYTLEPDNTLLLDKTRFVSYGAGIPEPEETPGAEFIVTEDGYYITKLNRHVNKLTMAVGLIANHAISFSYSDSSREFELKNLFKPQTSIILEIKRTSLLKYIFHKL
mgnify:CR=1 FL=1